MKSKLSVLLLATGLIGSALVAQEQQPAVVAQVPAETPAAPAPTPDRTVYAPRLPTPTELTAIAVAQGLSVERIDETKGQVSVTVKAADGRRTTVMYCLLASAGNTPAPVSTATYTTTEQPATTTKTVVVQSQPEVVYVNRPYYPYYYGAYYDPWAYWAPWAVGIGIGYSWGYYGGSYYGHGHSHGGYYGHGGHKHGGYHGGGGHHGGYRGNVGYRGGGGGGRRH